jgi:hypothetical protein
MNLLETSGILELSRLELRWRRSASGLDRAEGS